MKPVAPKEFGFVPSWPQRLWNANVPTEIIDRLRERYPNLPGHVVDALISDDHRSGISWLSAPSNDPVVAEHDDFFLLERLGYPIERFPFEANARATFHGILSGKSILWLLGISVGGNAVSAWYYLSDLF